MNEDPRIAELTAELLAALARFTGRLKAEHEDFLATHRLVDAKGAADLLDVKLSWVREKTATGEIPSIAMGGLRRYHPPSLLSWALSRQEAFPADLAAERIPKHGR